MTGAHHSDELLMQQIAQRDGAAFAALYDRHAQIVYNLIMRIVREPTTAEEVLQDTFWQVWLKAGEYQASGAVGAWLYRIARNKSLDQLRRQGTRPQPVNATPAQPSPDLALFVSNAPSVEAQAEHALQQRAIRQALADMPPEQRQCLELAYFDGLSQREIAAHTDTPLGTVKTRLRMGLAKLERSLRAAGWEAEDV